MKPTTRKSAFASAIGLTLTICAYSQQKSAQDGGKPAQPVGKAANAQENKDSKQRKLHIDYDELIADESNSYRDFKKATITDVDEGTVFKSDVLHVVDKPGAGKTAGPDSQTATATGNLNVDDKQAHIVGDKAVIYFAKSKRIVVVTDNVVIDVKPKKDKDPSKAQSSATPQNKTTEGNPAKSTAVNNGQKPASTADTNSDDGPGSAKKFPSKITCDKVEYEYAKTVKHAVLTGHFKAVQTLKDKTRTLTAEHAEWFGLEERVRLFPPVHVEDSKGMKADSEYEMDVFTKEGEEKLNMKKGMGEFLIDDDDEPADPKKPTKSDTKSPTIPAVPAGKPIIPPTKAAGGKPNTGTN